MAIEKDINPTVLNEENQVPLGDEGMEVALAAIEEAGMDDFVMQDDGSAILESSMQEPINTGFDENLAESMDDSDLGRISNELVDGIEKDKSSFVNFLVIIAVSSTLSIPSIISFQLFFFRLNKLNHLLNKLF